MLTLTQTALERLRTLIQEHPEDPIVRIALRDVNAQRLSLSITLESTTREDDAVEQIDGVTVALDRASAHRTSGMTVDFQADKGFLFVHPPANELGLIMPGRN
ncbi:MAG: hypothetical protein H8K06_17360 [Nitrospira sp.]|uniref:Fe-S_biosyn domain-containing protein n=1 Tax=Nitrospira defluvii TaxID=330214 RepID=A0ABM8QZS3_9BACT|nr:iron-sulfur cluster biosynthesis family protein [Nitrospira defluvii]MCS6328837.1 hypothetical protein [Nitrospira sp.]CAE6724879.1 Fe-S_biosyn domain-containing protein [Nitrospira defluvii]